MSAEIKAQWTINLMTECPGCRDEVDLTEDPDFWSATEIESCEHDTDRSRNLEVNCPKCGHTFEVACEY